MAAGGGSIIDRLVVALGFETDLAGAKEWVDAATRVTTVATSLASAVLGAATAIGAASTQAAGAMADMADFAQINDVAATTVEQLGHAALLSGSNLQALQGSIASVNRTAGEAALGIGRAAKVYQTLGIEVKNADGTMKSFAEIMLAVSDRMQGLSQQEAIAIATKLGFDQSLVPLLRRGRDEIEGLMEEVAQFQATEEDYANASALNDSLNRLRMIAKQLRYQLLSEFFPAIRDVTEQVRKWVIENRALIREKVSEWFNKVMVAAKFVWSVLTTLGNGVVKLIQLFGGLDRVLEILKVTLIAIAAVQTLKWVHTLITTLPALIKLAWAFTTSIGWLPLLLVAAAAAIYLLVDDLMAFFNGQDSFIGEMLQKYPAFAEVVRNIAQWLRHAWQWVVQTWQAALPTLQVLWGALVAFGAAFVGWMQAVWGIVSPVLSLLWSALAAVTPYIFQTLGLVLRVLGMIVIGVLQLVVQAITGVVQVFTWLLNTGTTILTKLGAGFQGFVSFIQGLFGGLNDFLKTGFMAALEWIHSKLDKIGDTAKRVGRWFGFGGDDTAPAAAPSGANYGALGASALATQGPLGAVANTTTKTQNNNFQTSITAPITINGAADPSQTAKVVAEQLGTLNRQGVRNAQNGVAL